jgi:hypothetical protein
VFKDGVLFDEVSLQEIRSRLEDDLKESVNKQ